MEQSGPSPASAPAHKRTRVLLVDRPDAARAATAAQLVARGFDVVLFGDATQAVADSIAHRADVVIINVALPGLEGFEAASILKRLDPGLEVILTTDRDPVPAGRSHRVDRFRCFSKPLDLEEISRAIDDGGGRDATREDES